MTFVHPLLLGGLLLVGVPVLLHLLMRQKPKRLPFPAFRFLVQKHRTNQTRLRLRHLLLLLLRMAVIAALCLALVRPALTGGIVSPMTGQPAAAVLLIDTSYSMEYAAAGKSRLDDAKRRALELLDELPDGSKVAVLDSAEAGGEWLPPGAARDRVTGLKLRHANAPLPRQIEQAYRLFAEQDRAVENPSEALPKVLYVFSDRTRGCWDEGAAKALAQPKDVSAVFVDVGAEGAADLAITEVKTEPAAVRPGDTVKVNVTVRATGADYETDVVCGVDGKEERKGLKLKAGQGQVVTFDLRTAGPAADGAAQDGLAEGLHQVEVRLANSDALPFDNAAFATFRVLEGRSVLVLADDSAAATRWADMVRFVCRPDVREVRGLNPDSFRFDDYAAACLFNVAEPSPALWSRLKKYVADGHGLAVILGGDGKARPLPAFYNDDKSAAELLPAKLDGIVQAAGDEEGFWAEFGGDARLLAGHPLLARFGAWKKLDPPVGFFTREGRPRAYRSWKVTPAEGADVLTHYTDKDGKAGAPALLERAAGRGRVLMLTTAMSKTEDWNNYFTLSPFGFSLSCVAVEHLAGDARPAALNFVAGEAVTVPLPDKPFLPTYMLTGPGVVGSDATLPRQPDQHELRVTNAVTPGNFAVLAVPDERRGAQRLAAFSVNARPDEHVLDRVPAEQIEALLGEGSVLPVGRTASLRDRLQERWAQPLELAPWLLIALLLALALESLLANRFYRVQSSKFKVQSEEGAGDGADQSVRGHDGVAEGSRVNGADLSGHRVG